MAKTKKKTIWEQAQEWEGHWWNRDSCKNTFNEEMKQHLYMNRMGLKWSRTPYTIFNIDVNGMKILDIGGGPVSMLLKVINADKLKVVDPLKYPKWVEMRYKDADIEYERVKGEDIKEKGYDEVWIYNVLQHVDDPKKVAKNALKAGKIVRVFEWIETDTNEGHPHTFDKKDLDKLFEGKGKEEQLQGQNQCFGKCYYGIFKGK